MQPRNGLKFELLHQIGCGHALNVGNALRKSYFHWIREKPVKCDSRQPIATVPVRLPRFKCRELFSLSISIAEHVTNYSEIPAATTASASIPTTSTDQAGNEKLKFSETINPLLTFSKSDLAAMNEDVDEFFESDSSDEDNEGTGDAGYNGELSSVVIVHSENLIN